MFGQRSSRERVPVPHRHIVVGLVSCQGKDHNVPDASKEYISLKTSLRCLASGRFIFGAVVQHLPILFQLLAQEDRLIIGADKPVSRGSSLRVEHDLA